MDPLQQRLASLAPEQRRLLEKRLREKGRENLLERPEGAAGRRQVVVELPGEAPRPEDIADRTMAFSLFFFSGDGSTARDDKYDLLLATARFGDRHGYAAVWTPERHFQDFGGLYPNPAVVGAALAVITEHIQIRAGSVAVPLHNPIRLAEEWAVVDNLSRGRVALSVASGWHPEDFALAPEAYDDRKRILFEHLELLEHLWSGGTITRPIPGGREIEITILPRPLQPKLEYWIAISGNPESWVQAGEIGANVLTALLNQGYDELAEKIRLYHDALRRHGHDPATRTISVMLHTCLGESTEEVKEQVREPLYDYFASYLKQHDSLSLADQSVTDEEKRALIAVSFERYFYSRTLCGSVDQCSQLIDRLLAIGVNEIACLLDFGLDTPAVLASLEHLNQLKERYARPREVEVAAGGS